VGKRRVAPYANAITQHWYSRNLYVAAFAQDSGTATDRLTVNYDVHWDRIRPCSEKFNQLQTLVKGEQIAGISQSAGRTGIPGDLGVPSFTGPRAQRLRHLTGGGVVTAPESAWMRRCVGTAGKTSERLGCGMFHTAFEGLSAASRRAIRVSSNRSHALA
jgi:hypothetical protein